MHCAHIIAYYQRRIDRMGSWPMRRPLFLAIIAAYRKQGA